jgi:catalase
MHGLVTFAPAITAHNDPVDKVRGKPEKFAEHYTQAKLFFDSQTPVEQAHIVAAFRFELSKVTVPAIRTRMVSSLRNASEALASAVADGLGIEMPDAMPRALPKKGQSKGEVERSAMLSLKARPGDGGIATRKVAILLADGMEGALVSSFQEKLTAAGAVIRLLGVRLGSVTCADGSRIQADATLENSPAVLFDGMVLPGGNAAQRLSEAGQTLEFLKDQYRHGKSILVQGDSGLLLDKAGITSTLPDGSPDPGIIKVESGTDGADRFISALSKHRHFERELDPPIV